MKCTVLTIPHRVRGCLAVKTRWETTVMSPWQPCRSAPWGYTCHSLSACLIPALCPRRMDEGDEPKHNETGYSGSPVAT